ncbi:MAG: acyltransferase family protein [Pedobacter sp.]|uniref:acyltransferase family protein n=1 Tax=Pedobacter sp. TaxID=1411316 RepID=UPI00339AE1A1
MSTLIAEIKPIQRVMWIDYAKFIGIVLVICAHQTTNKGWFDFISAFDIPLFFFLSGFLFSFKKFDTYSQFLKARVKQLLVPYLLLNLVAYIFWLFFFKNFDEMFVSSGRFYKSFFGIFYGNGYGDWLIHCIATWFIICLFSLENIYFLVFRKLTDNQKYIALVCFLPLCWLDRNYMPFWLPWGIDIALVGIIFYGVGNLFKTRVFQLIQLSMLKLSVISILAFAVLLFVAQRTHSDMNQHQYSNFKLFFVGAFAGITCVITLSRIIELGLGHISIFQFVAQNTLFIMAFHLFVMTIVNKFILDVFDISSKEIAANGFIGAIVVVPTVFLLIPLIYLCNRYFPVIVGKPSASKQTAILPKEQVALGRPFKGSVGM